MDGAELAAELARWGPDAAYHPPLLAESRDYCRRFTRRQYENFHVASWLLPRSARVHFWPIYAYCRWADDLGDEILDRARAGELLKWWERELDACYGGVPRHPVMVALAATIDELQIPRDPFARLLGAFRQDQQVTRYETLAQLLDYCRSSANPVGELVLYVAGCHNEQTREWSNHICTALQLTNFWQDVRRDYEKGRVYVPQEVLDQHGIAPDQFATEFAAATDRARQVVRDLVDRTENMFRQGAPLVDRLPAEWRTDMALFVEGGRAVLAAIREQDYAVWRRPVISKRVKLQLLLRCWWRARRTPYQVLEQDP